MDKLVKAGNPQRQRQQKPWKIPRSRRSGKEAGYKAGNKAGNQVGSKIRGKTRDKNEKSTGMSELGEELQRKFETEER